MSGTERRLSCRLPRSHPRRLEDDTMKTIILAAKVLLVATAGGIAAALSMAYKFRGWL